MSSIIVFGAGGNAGRLITAEAASRGHQVLAVVRDPNPELELPDGVRVAAGDPTDPASVRALVPGSDVLVLAIGGPDPGLWRTAAQTLVQAIAELPAPRPRIVHMGGGASLTTPDGTRFLDLPGFPEEYRASAAGQADALEYYRSSAGADWTYLSPPPVNFHFGARRGTYRTGLDQPVVDANGESSLSYADFAVAVVDEIEDPQHLNERFTAGY